MFPPLTFMVDLTMNLMSGPHYKCERREHHSLYSESTLRITLPLPTTKDGPKGPPAPLPSKPASKFNLTSNYLTQKLKQNKQTNKQINKKILANSILRNNIILCFSFFFGLYWQIIIS